MAKRFGADVRNWTEKAKLNARLVAAGAIQDVGERMTRRAAGTTDGGTVQVGFVPVVDGELINSHQISVNAGVVATGGVDYGAALVGLELGDTVMGTFSAPHARPKEYGYTTSTGKQVPGWFFVREAVQGWQGIVDANAAKFGG